MTPDRQDQNPDDAENGVLADTGSINTTGFDILGGSTEQVEVTFPIASEDDDLDDDVVGDEVAIGADLLGTDTAQAEIIETGAVDTAAEHGDGGDDVIDAELVDTGSFDPIMPGDRPDGESPISESVADAGPVAQAGVADELADGAVAEPEVDDMLDPEIASDADAERPGDEGQPGAEAEENGPTIETAELDALIAGAIAAHPRGERSREAGTGTGATPTATGEASEPDRAPSTRATTPAPSPATRWEAHHPDNPERPARAVERTPVRADISLTSKRLGEFEANRESADLLTPDRLLDPHQVVKPEPEGVWQHFIYTISGKRIHLGDSKRAQARKELDRRIAAPLTGGARFVPVVSRKGGVGKTTVTTLLGMALADARDDRIIAVDANPDRGTLADRVSRASGKTVRDLVRSRGEVSGYADISSIVARDETRLDVLASDSDPRVSEAFSDRDYHDVARIAAHYYSIVLTDTGTGIVHSVMSATLDRADQLVIVAGLSVDEARLASETITWLETNGYAERVRNAVVVLNHARPGAPIVRADELEAHFRSRVRAVVQIPYDPHIAAGSAIAFRDLQPATRLAARELAATVVEGLRALAVAA